MNDAGHILDVAAAHALHALQPEEAMQVEQHVEICPTCKEALEQARETVGVLALTAQPVRPPAHTKSRLMDRIEREEFLRRPTRPRRTAPAWMGYGLMAVLMVALVGWNVKQQMDLAFFNKVQQFMTADSSPSELAPSEPNGKPFKARMYTIPDSHEALLVLDTIDPAPNGHSYELWVANDAGVQSMGTFTGEQSTKMLIVRTQPEPLKSFKWAMVTVEANDGNPAPTEPTVLFGDL